MRPAPEHALGFRNRVAEIVCGDRFEDVLQGVGLVSPRLRFLSMHGARGHGFQACEEVDDAAKIGAGRRAFFRGSGTRELAV